MSDKKKVVIIDDDEGACLMIKETLETGGEFEVTIVTDPKQAEGVIKQATPDVVLLDIVMPVRKGTEIIDAIKKDSDLKRIPIVVLSGKGEMIYDKKKKEFHWQPNNPAVKTRGTLPDAKGAEALAQAYGVTDYISKPFTHEILIEVLNETIAKVRKKKAADEDAPPPLEP